jgi:hypothetical protein
MFFCGNRTGIRSGAADSDGTRCLRESEALDGSTFDPAGVPGRQHPTDKAI